MSTPNFYSKAGTVYALDFSDDAGEYDADLADIVIEDVTTAVIEELRQNGLSVDVESEDDGERSYPGHVFGKVELKNARDDIYCTAALVIRSGYYADANLDFEIKVYTSYDGEYSDVEDLDLDIVSESCAVEKQLTRAQFNKYQKAGRAIQYSDSDYFNTITTYVIPTRRQVLAIEKRIHLEANKLEDAIRKVYAKYTTPYRRVAVFSNGEALYEKIGGSDQ